MESDLQELKVKFRQKVNNREEWASVCKGGQGSERTVEPRSKLQKYLFFAWAFFLSKRYKIITLLVYVETYMNTYFC
jgi:hypothetical protein